jgi:cytochrome c oxidase subunit IV
MERDDIIEYSLDAHHSEEKGVEIRKKIVQVTILLSAITAVEIIVGVFMGKRVVTPSTWVLIKYGYIVLTLFKAWYIIKEFMHLGHERKSFKKVVLYPYIFFIIYLIFILLVEGSAVFIHNNNFDWIQIYK